jgi:hypothetical protein
LPQRRTSSVALALKITGSRLRDFEPPAPDTPAIAANAEGVFLVPVDQAVLHGGLRPERQGGKDNLGFWDSPSHWAEWKLDVRAPGRYSVSFASSTPHAGSRIKVQLGRRTLDVPIPTTGSWQDFRDVRAGELRVDKAAATTLALRPGDAATWKAVNVADIVVRRMP